jgi:hypothetical protein
MAPAVRLVDALEFRLPLPVIVRAGQAGLIVRYYLSNLSQSDVVLEWAADISAIIREPYRRPRRGLGRSDNIAGVISKEIEQRRRSSFV